MTIATDLNRVADLCREGAKRTLGIMLALGPRPMDEVSGLLWDQQSTRLQGQLNSLTAMVSKVTAAAVVESLRQFAGPLAQIAALSEEAQARVAEIKHVSEALTKLAKVLDLGLAVLAASAAPSAATMAAVVVAGDAVTDAFSD